LAFFIEDCRNPALKHLLSSFPATDKPQLRVTLTLLPLHMLIAYGMHTRMRKTPTPCFQGLLTAPESPQTLHSESSNLAAPQDAAK
jgi:hypothetical protein